MAAVRSPKQIDPGQDQKECNDALHHVKDACGLNLKHYLALLQDNPQSVAEKLQLYKARMAH